MVEQKDFFFLTPTLLFPPEELKHEIYLRIEWEEIRATWDSAKRILGILFNSFHTRPLQLSGEMEGEAVKIRAGRPRNGAAEGCLQGKKGREYIFLNGIKHPNSRRGAGGEERGGCGKHQENCLS